GPYSPGGPTTIDRQIGARDICGSGAEQEYDRTGDFLRVPDPPERDLALQFQKKFRRRSLKVVFGKRPRGDSVHANASVGQMAGKVTGHLKHPGFRCAIVDWIILTACPVDSWVRADTAIHRRNIDHGP